ncbi:hypothetical protein L1887_38539 [Cichorium endivia]|nr:hypothetical protein L1887_38539 [Cichorium endivia]
MGDKVINDNLQNDQETEAEAVLETLSLTDFPVTQDHGVSSFQDQLSPPSSATGEFFEFFQGSLNDYSDDSMMSHAEDIIFCGKLIPIHEQRRHKKPPEQKEKSHRSKQQQQPTGCRRSESMTEVKSTPAIPVVRNSRSLDYKKLHRNSSMSSEPTPEILRDGSGKKSSSSRWYVLLFGLVKVPPPEMDLRDMKNRQVRRTPSKILFPSSESCDVLPVSGSDDYRKCSWKVLGFLSCKSAASTDATTPLRYMPKV